jgi:hypothetical protein
VPLTTSTSHRALAVAFAVLIVVNGILVRL